MKKQSHGDCASLCMELSLFLAAGVDFASAFDLLAEKAEEKTTEGRMRRASRALAAGASLATVLSDEGLLPQDGVSLVSVGEETGRVEETLSSLTQYYRRREESARALRAAITYPAVLALVMVAVVLVLVTKVLPVFSDIYASLGGEMGAFATVLCEIGVLSGRAMPVLFWCFVALLALAILCAVIQPLRVQTSALFQKLLCRTRVSRLQARARFADALAMALCSGYAPAQAVEAATRTLVGTALFPDGQDAVLQIKSGVEPMEALRLCGLLPPDECKLLSLGMAGGAVEVAAEECARRAYNRAEDALARAVSSIEPVIVVLTSLLVGGILLSVLFPLTEILSAIG